MILMNKGGSGRRGSEKRWQQQLTRCAELRSTRSLTARNSSTARWHISSGNAGDASAKLGLTVHVILDTFYVVTASGTMLPASQSSHNSQSNSIPQFFEFSAGTSEAYQCRKFQRIPKTPGHSVSTSIKLEDQKKEIVQGLGKVPKFTIPQRLNSIDLAF